MKSKTSKLVLILAASILTACLGGGGDSGTSTPPDNPSPGATAPSSPSNPIAFSGYTLATVTFATPASDGGDPIDGYTVTSSPAGGMDNNAGTTSLSHVITGLINGIAYTFTVIAHNSRGFSEPSIPSK